MDVPFDGMMQRTDAEIQASNFFADIVDNAYLGVTIDPAAPSGYPYVFHFDGTLTDAEVAAVRLRCETTAQQESDRKTLNSLQTDIANLQGQGATMSATQLTSAVKLLGNAVAALDRLSATRFRTTNH